MLGKIIGQRTRNRVLQQHLVGLQPVPVNGLHLRGVEIHGHDADHHEHTEDYVQNRNAHGAGLGGQVPPSTNAASRRSGGRI